MTFQELMASFSITPDLSNENSYHALLAQMKDRITPVIGAGLSCWAGYPLWSKLLTDKAKGTFVEEKVKSFLEDKQYETAATELEQFYRRNNFLDALRKEYSPKKIHEENRPNYQHLLDRLFPGPFVTTNFDVSLERLLNAPYVITPESRFEDTELQHRIQCHERMLIKLHGTVDDPEHMILTEERYNETYGPDPENPDLSLPLPDALQRVFNGAPPLFLGCSLGPDRTCAVLRVCKGASGFALVELPEETENTEDPFKPKLCDENGWLPAFAERQSFLDSLNLKVIWYPYNKYEAVDVLIKQLAKDRDLSSGSTAVEQKETMEEEKNVGSPHSLDRDDQVREVVERLKGPNTHNYSKMLIVVATSLELQVLLKRLEAVSEVRKTISSISFFSATIGSTQTYVVKSQMGQGGVGGSILTLEEAIRVLNPDYVIMGGIAWGGNKEKQHIGDLLISNQVWDYDIERKNPDGSTIYRGAISPSSPRLVQMFEVVCATISSYKTRYGLVASGSDLFDNRDCVDELKAVHSELIGGDMESAGMASVCTRKKVDWIMAKGICDWGYDKNDHKDEYQELAANNSMDAIVSLLLQFSPQ